VEVVGTHVERRGGEDEESWRSLSPRT